MKLSLLLTHPQLADQWHPTKNDELTPDQVTAGSTKKVWWKCPVGSDHEWQISPNSRSSSNSSCPFCAGRQPSITNSLGSLYPQLSEQWHPSRNGLLQPHDVVAGSEKKVWWQCSKAEDHEWQAAISSRTKGGNGCPFCAGRECSTTNSLAGLYPELAAEWHPIKNGSLTPEQVVAGSHRKVWWKCYEGTDHEWEAVIKSRARGNGCPYCARKKVSITNSLAALYPELAKEWHPTKNGEVRPDRVVAGSSQKVWWQCSKNPQHEWAATLDGRTNRNSGCPFCTGSKVSEINSLSSLCPELVKEWHPTKNGSLTPDQIAAKANKKVWWMCSQGVDHEWEAKPSDRARGSGCPFCRSLRVSVTNSLHSLAPEIAKEWHPTKNGSLTPDQVVAGSIQKVWWKCSAGEDHEWEAEIRSRFKGTGCPCCAGLKVSITNSLLNLKPEIAQEWHPTKNGTLSPKDVVANSNRKVWWICAKDPFHEWEATIWNRTHGKGCPVCNCGWTIATIRGFVASLLSFIDIYTPAELFIIFQQAGLFRTDGKGRGFLKALSTGKFPKEELEKFVAGEPSLVDDFIKDAEQTLEGLESSNLNQTQASDEEDWDQAVSLENPESTELPTVETQAVLNALEHPVISSADEEAIEFLLASAKAKIWKHAFQNEQAAVEQANRFQGEGYGDRVQAEFLDEYHQVKSLQIPAGYAFQLNGKLTAPNLMQRLIAVRVRDQKRVGNWSGTGAGKTLSAILASRVVNACLTLICCPNSVVNGWRQAISEIFPKSQIATKTFTPNWDKPESPYYLVLNYEMFQQADSLLKLRLLLDSATIDCIVIDEIHYTKQRYPENEKKKVSQRRELVNLLVVTASEKNPDLRVLGMSATPVINNLQEGKSLVELVTGVQHPDLEIRPTVPNCMKLHQKLVTLGIRWKPDYEIQLGRLSEHRIEIDCSNFLDEIRTLKKVGTSLALEKILTQARLPNILENLQPKTLIYTHYVQDIDLMLIDAIIQAGWKVGCYTGEDKSGLEKFLNGNLDILIGSSAIATGVDRLQHVCNRLVLNVLPWTNAEYEQLLGRIYRQGQKNPVTIVLPITYATVNGERWSWCESKMKRLEFKKSIADAAVDGTVPEGHLRSPAQAYQDVMAWLERLEKGEIETIQRQKISIPIFDSDEPTLVEKRLRQFGDFSRMNHRWNQSNSQTTHQRLQEDPEEWHHYHALYREARKTWEVIPYEEIIRWCERRNGLVIGDFGCGEAKIAEALSDRHQVYSFDHVAANSSIVACDIAKTPLGTEELDIAIFSLSLMGENFTDYLREAYRTLKLDGQLHLIEPKSRFQNLEQFQAGLHILGFDIISTHERWKFIHIRAIKSERLPQPELKLTFSTTSNTMIKAGSTNT